MKRKNMNPALARMTRIVEQNKLIAAAGQGEPDKFRSWC